MKLLIITSIKEYQALVHTIMKKASVSIFSTADTTGIRTNDESHALSSWLGSQKEEFDSYLAFSFTSDVNAERAVQLTNEYNTQLTPAFPLHTFVIDVSVASGQ